jgi:hypothetical protein
MSVTFYVYQSCATIGSIARELEGFEDLSDALIHFHDSFFGARMIELSQL